MNTHTLYIHTPHTNTKKKTHTKYRIRSNVGHQFELLPCPVAHPFITSRKTLTVRICVLLSFRSMFYFVFFCFVFRWRGEWRGFLDQNLRLSFCRIAVKRGFCNESNMMLNVVRKICEIPHVHPRMQNFPPVIQFTQCLLGTPTHLQLSLATSSIFPFPSVFRSLFLPTRLSAMRRVCHNYAAVCVSGFHPDCSCFVTTWKLFTSIYCN